jgi:FYVE/RhoGEF/PH domain-containing protein 5/6
MAAAMDVRSRVLEEIVATERTFVESLRTCIAVFHAPLEAAVGSRCEDVDGPLGRLLKELALLEPFNSALLGELEAEVAGHGNVGRVFRRFAPFLKMFSRYLELYVAWSDDREARGGDPSGDRDVRAFLGAAASDPRCRSLDLASFLVAPVQRVPRYRLLLEELAKRTAESHGDRADLDAALALVSEAAGHNNNALAEDAHHATLAALQRSIFDPKGELNVLDWPGRRLVRGPLELKKLCRKGPKHFTFWLLSDCLLYAQRYANAAAVAQRGGAGGDGRGRTRERNSQLQSLISRPFSTRFG